MQNYKNKGKGLKNTCIGLEFKIKFYKFMVRILAQISLIWTWKIKQKGYSDFFDAARTKIGVLKENDGGLNEVNLWRLSYCMEPYTLINTSEFHSLSLIPQGNKKYMRHIQLLTTKIYFSIIEIYVKYILANMSHFHKKYICKKYFRYTSFGKNIFYTFWHRVDRG